MRHADCTAARSSASCVLPPVADVVCGVSSSSHVDGGGQHQPGLVCTRSGTSTRGDGPSSIRDAQSMRMRAVAPASAAHCTPCVLTVPSDGGAGLDLIAVDIVVASPHCSDSRRGHGKRTERHWSVRCCAAALRLTAYGLARAEHATIAPHCPVLPSRHAHCSVSTIADHGQCVRARDGRGWSRCCDDAARMSHQTRCDARHGCV